jgi:hypothetical protein
MENDKTDYQTKSDLKNEDDNVIAQTVSKQYLIYESSTLQSDYDNFLIIYYEQLRDVEAFYSNKLYELMKDFTNLSKKMHNKKSSVIFFNLDYSSK